MDFTAEYILENSIVRMEPLQEKHILPLEPLAEEKAVWTYFLGRSNGSMDFKSYVEDAIAHRKKGKEYPFAVFDKRSGQCAGTTRFFEFSQELGTIRLGYTWYGKPYHGTGLNKNCKYLLFEFALETLGQHRVGLGAHAENTVSIHAMKSIGCTEEGKLRDLFPAINGPGRAAAVLFSMTKTDWLSGEKDQLKKRL